MSTPRADNAFYSAGCWHMEGDVVRVVRLSAALKALLDTLDDEYGSAVGERLDEQVRQAREVLREDYRHNHALRAIKREPGEGC